VKISHVPVAPDLDQMVPNSWELPYQQIGGEGRAVRLLWNLRAGRVLNPLRHVMDQGPYPAEKARGGEIILNTPFRRAIFVAGLIGAIGLVLIVTMVR
jgi:hypothetical protein